MTTSRHFVKFYLLIALFCSLGSPIVLAESGFFASKTPYQVCFTPGEDCTQLIVDNFESSKKIYFCTSL